MAINCSLVTPNQFSFQLAGCSENFDNVCNNNGIIKKIFKIELPPMIDKGILSINITNIITQKSISKSVIVPDPVCGCNKKCDTEPKVNSTTHIVAIEFNNLIDGDKYTGTACFAYID